MAKQVAQLLFESPVVSLSNRRPIAWHNNGGHVLPLFNFGPAYTNLMARRFLRSRREPVTIPPHLDIVICHNYKQTPLTLRCMRHLGISGVHELGQDLEKFQHFDKVPLLLDFLQNRSTAEYVLHFDAKDVLVLDDPAIILDRFLSAFSCDILFNSEKGTYPGVQSWLPRDDKHKLRMIEEFEKATYPQPFQHLNAGCFIGRKQAVISMLEQAATMRGYLTSHPKDDQGILREIHVQRYPRIQIDARCQVFQSLFMARRSELSLPHRIGGVPLFLHHVAHVGQTFIRRRREFRKLMWKHWKFIRSKD